MSANEKYRVWCNHPESDFYGWIDSKICDTYEEAEQHRRKMYEEGHDGCAEYEVKMVTPTGEEF